jgi:lysophospholipase L1-like esterase
MRSERWITIWSYAQRRTSFTKWENQNSFKLEIPNNVAGYGIKLKFSNWYGTRTVGVRSVKICLREQEYLVKVNFQQEFSVSPDRDVFSDVIFLDIAPKDILKVKVIFVDQLRPESGNTFQNGIAMILQSVLLVTNEKVNVVAFFGDSITHGQKWTKPLVEEWYKRYSGKLAAFEVAVGGSRLLSDSPVKEDETLGFRAITRFKHDIIENEGINYVVFALGLNDLSMEEGELLTLESYQKEVLKLIDLAHEREIKMIALTITPRIESEYYTLKKNDLRKEINQWILNDAPFDLAVDIASSVANEDDTALKKEYRDIDGIHINEAAGKVIADLLKNTQIF